jgi:D-alanine-D-alanine ligase
VKASGARSEAPPSERGSPNEPVAAEAAADSAPDRHARRARKAVKRLRVTMLLHRDFLPPEDLTTIDAAEAHRVKTEISVRAALNTLGHEVTLLAVHDELAEVRRAVEEGKPDIVFNLLEEFQGSVLFDHHVVSFLELLRAKYTGCGPRGLVLARDKALSKAIAAHHRIRAPGFAVIKRSRGVRKLRLRRLAYPLIVKSLTADSSLGISRASLVRDDEHLAERVRFIHERIGSDAIVEEFVAGREIYVSLLGNERVTALPPNELLVEKLDPKDDLIVTEKLKHDLRYQVDRGVEVVPAQLAPETRARLIHQSKRLYKLLHLDGYARLDWRLREDGALYFLEANPNPEIARGEEFADSAQAAGIGYETLVQRILALGLAR